MGTRFEVVVWGEGEDPGRFTLFIESCADAALDEIAYLDGRLSLFRKASFLCHINALAAEQPVRLDGELFGLFDRCREIHERSLGAFDLTVAPLMRTFGFHDGEGETPSPDDLERARAAVGQGRLLLDEKTSSVRFADPATRVDLGGAGKGFALDSAIEVLREEGIENAQIHGGTSTVAAIGAPPGEDGFDVGIRDPRSRGKGESRSLVCRVRLANEALAVSAPHGRFFRADGRIQGHVMNPARGEPAQDALLSAVVCRSALDADAWSTAFLAAGAGEFARLADRAPGVTALLMDSDGKIRIQGERPEIFMMNPGNAG